MKMKGEVSADSEESFLKLDDDEPESETDEKPKKIKRVPSGSKAAMQDQERGVIYLSHIPHGFYEKEMFKFFSQFGSVSNIKMGRSKRTGKPRGYAFIEFRYSDVAKIVAETMNNYLMFEKLLKCKVVPPEEVKASIFKGKIDPRKPPGVQARLQDKKRINAPKTEDQEARRSNKLQARAKKVNAKLALLGIHVPVIEALAEPPRKIKKADAVNTTPDVALAKVGESGHDLKRKITAPEPGKKKTKLGTLGSDEAKENVATIRQGKKKKLDNGAKAPLVTEGQTIQVPAISEPGKKKNKVATTNGTTQGSKENVATPELGKKKNKVATTIETAQLSKENVATPEPSKKKSCLTEEPSVKATPEPKKLMATPKQGKNKLATPNAGQNQGFSQDLKRKLEIPDEAEKKKKIEENGKVETLTSSTKKSKNEKKLLQTTGSENPKQKSVVENPKVLPGIKTPGHEKPSKKMSTPGTELSTPVKPSASLSEVKKSLKKGEKKDPDQPAKTPKSEYRKTPGENNIKSGKKTPGSKTPGSKTPGSKTPGSKTPSSKSPGLKGIHLDLSVLLGTTPTPGKQTEASGKKDKKKSLTPMVMEVDSDDEEITMKTPPNVQKIKSRNNSRATSKTNTPTIGASISESLHRGMFEKLAAIKSQKAGTPKSGTPKIGPTKTPSTPKFSSK